MAASSSPLLLRPSSVRTLVFYSLCIVGIRVSNGLIPLNQSLRRSFLINNKQSLPSSYLSSSQHPLLHLSSTTSTNENLGPSSSSNSNYYPVSSNLPERIQHRDVVIVGSGLAGLSAALYLTQMDPSRHVTILDRLDPSTGRGKTSAGSFAAAGMLAPQSERLPSGHLLDLCLESRRMFAGYCDLVERLARESGSEGMKYYQNKDDDDDANIDPWSVGYMATGGFLAPAFAGDAVATWAPPEDCGSATWLDATQVRELEPNLHPDVTGGWWFPEDASVDALRLTCSLRAACVQAGVQILSGPEYEIKSLDLHDDACRGLWITKGNQYIAAKAVLLANGAWMRDLLPVPVEPHKGQSLSLRMPADRPNILRRVLFAQDSYIVPKADGTIVIGATVEAGSYDPNVTPAGIMHILTHALQLLPALKDLPIVETWAGLRPTTPDKGPILGKTRWDNLYLAGGYWRNGVLLAPKSGQLLASLITGQSLSEKDADLLRAFSWDRFTDTSAGISLAANSRYAASMHPIHRRTTGFGVAASVGTELGSYSSARSAADDRKRDRAALLSSDGDDDALERAAAQGKLDSTAYIFGDGEKYSRGGDADMEETAPEPLWPDLLKQEAATTIPFEGSADALTVGSAVATSASKDEQPEQTKSLDDAYKKILANKAKVSEKLNAEVSLQQEEKEEQPDPGFRIYHVDADTGEERVVPPYTSPGEFLESIEKEKKKADAGDSEPSRAVVASSNRSVEETDVNTSGDDDSYSEKTYDGYQDIQQANSRSTREEELEAMRAARRSNRLGQSSIDPSKIGAVRDE